MMMQKEMYVLSVLRKLTTFRLRHAIIKLVTFALYGYERSTRPGHVLTVG